MKFKNGLPVVMTCAAVCVFSASQSIFAPLALLIGKGFGRGAVWTGLLFVAYYIMNIVVCPFAGRVISKIGCHHTISIGLLLFAASALLLSYANRFELVLLCLAVAGTTSVLVLLAGMELRSGLTGREHTSGILSVSVGMGAGAVAGAVYVCVMLFRCHSWRDIYFGFGIVVAVFALIYAVLPIRGVPTDSGWQGELSSALRLQRMYPSYLILFLYAGASITATSWMAAYMMQTLGYTTVIAAIAGILMWSCITFGRFICIRLVSHYPALNISAVLTIILICSLCLCGLVPDGRLFWIAVFGIGLGLSGLWPLLTGAALFGNGGGATLSVILLWECAGAAVLPFLAGLLGNLAGMRMVVFLSAALFLIIGFSMQHVLSPKRAVASMRRVRRPPAARPPEEPEVNLNDEAS